MLMSNLFYHLTDSKWKKIEIFFTARRSRGRPPLNPRVVLNGISWILRNGARWRDLLTCFDNWRAKKFLQIKLILPRKFARLFKSIGATVCVPDKSNAVVKHDFDEELYKKRNIVERFFQRIKEFRHIVIRFDKLDICFLNFIFLAAFILHL